MTYMKKILTILAVGIMAAGQVAFAQSTSKLTATKANEYGLIYTLPRTAFEVTIAAEKTVKTPGEFYQYAKKYLSTDPILKSSTSWKVVDAVDAERGSGYIYLS